MKNYYSFFLMCTLWSQTQLVARSIFRPQKPYGAKITVTTNNTTEAKKWHVNKNTICSELTSRYLKLKPLQEKFNYPFLQQHNLPARITPRNQTTPHDTEQLKKEIENLICEVQKGKTHFKNFTILQKRDFNFKDQAGLLVVKPHDHPLVVKLFIEHPCTFTNPFDKSFEASCMFTLGGSLRHLCGFTRIPNLQAVKEKLQQHPTYKHKIQFPQKWFYIPENSYWLDITWHNIHKNTTKKIHMPAIYCIIADYIDVDEEKQHQKKIEIQKESMNIVNYLEFAIDPHNGNFVYEKNNPDHLVILDTEHFPTVIGLEKGMKAKNYISWYLEMSANFVKEVFFKPKSKLLQQLPE